MKTFNDLIFIKHPRHRDVIQAMLNFENGYGVSVIKSPFSHGGEKGLFELAVFKGNQICYDTNITDDVLGWLTEENVTDNMIKVQQLEGQTK